MKKNLEVNCLRKIRTEKGLTQKDVAEAVGTTANQISRLENGNRKLAPEWLERLSVALDCSKAALLGETEVLSEREKLLLDYFRNSDKAGQDLILKTGDTVSKLVSKDGKINEKTG